MRMRIHNEMGNKRRSMAKRVKKSATRRPTWLFGESCGAAGGTITGERKARDQRLSQDFALNDW